MIKILQQWYDRNFNSVEAGILVLFIVAIMLMLYTVGNILKPVIASIIVAYVLSGLVTQLEKHKCPHVLSVLFVYFLFIGGCAFTIFVIFPPLWQQTMSFFRELPTMVSDIQKVLSGLPERYPTYVTDDQLLEMANNFKILLANTGKRVLSYSLASIPSVISLVMYFILVPFLVYFFLMDKQKILNWVSQYLPTQRSILYKVWCEVNEQFGNYIRGRVVEVVIVTLVSYICYLFLGLHYTMLLAVITGISVIVPYIGAAVATIPVLLIGLFQWGWSVHFAYLVMIYTVLAILAGYVLEPLLFSETLDLHPIVIIISVLFFGGLWGFWGVFFAIPLATVVRAILNAWPSQ